VWLRMAAMCGGSTKIEPTVDGVSAEAGTSAGRKSFRCDCECLAFKGVAGASWTWFIDELKSQEAVADNGRSLFMDINLRDRRFSNKKPKTSAAGRNSDSVVCFGGSAGLSSEV
jgi:hypothetical protein